MIGRGEHAEIVTVRRRHRRLRALGQHDRPVPGRRAHHQAVPLQRAHLGAVAPQVVSARTTALGANLIVQVKSDRVMRVLPLENEASTSAGSSDRDRFSYEALNSDERLTAPMIKQGGEWQTVDWQTALEYVARRPEATIKARPRRAEHRRAGVSPHSTLEELYLLAQAGARPRQRQHRLPPAPAPTSRDGRAACRWLGMPIAALSQLERVLVVGSFLRKDHPLFAQRLRQAARKGAQVLSVHRLGRRLADADGPCRSQRRRRAERMGCRRWPTSPPRSPTSKGVAAPVARRRRPTTRQGDRRSRCCRGERKAILLGNAAAQHPQARAAAARWRTGSREQTGATRRLPRPKAATPSARSWSARCRRHGRPERRPDARRRRALKAVPAAATSSRSSTAADRRRRGAALGKARDGRRADARSSAQPATIADVLLPIAPFTETSGTFVNAEGRVQSFHGVVKPLGETRPAWKVLRVLGNLLGLPGFDYETSERSAAPKRCGDAGTAARAADAHAAASRSRSRRLERIADVPIYAPTARAPRRRCSDRRCAAAEARLRDSCGSWRRAGRVQVRRADGARRAARRAACRGRACACSTRHRPAARACRRSIAASEP